MWLLHGHMDFVAELLQFFQQKTSIGMLSCEQQQQKHQRLLTMMPPPGGYAFNNT